MLTETEMTRLSLTAWPGRVWDLRGVIHADAERLQETHIVGGHGEFRIGVFAAQAHQFRRRSVAFLIPMIEADSGLQNQKDVVALVLDPGDHLRDLLRFGKGAVDGLPQ